METDVTMAQIAGWAAELEALAERVAPRFQRVEARRRVGAFLRGLLSSAERKNGWQLAEQAGEATPDGMQRLLYQARWDADQVRDDLRGYVVEHLGAPGGVLVVDETGFVKKGSKSAGVQRQYSGTAGRIENCQVGVFLTYASQRGAALIDRALYLPECWTTDRVRRQQAAIPDQVEFQTKPQLARVMLERGLDAGVPVGWVTADEAYGQDKRLRVWLEAREIPYVLAIKRNDSLALPIRPLREPGAGHWLLARRSLDDGELAYYVCYGPEATTLAELVCIAGTRWTVECCFQQAKGEAGLDHYEVRRYDAWYRHITLSMLAHAFLVVMRACQYQHQPAAAELPPHTGGQ